MINVALRFLPLLLAASLARAVFFPAPAAADVTVEFSDAIKTAVNPQTQEDIQNLVNAGLRKKAGDGAAKDLLDSGQTIKIICHDEKKAKDEGIDFGEAGIIPDFGKTKGDFDAMKKPKRGGTVYIAINCDYLRQFGWHNVINVFGTEQSMWDVLVHELLHATNQDRQHPPDDTEIYEKWVKDYNGGIKDEIRTARANEGKKVASLPRQPTEFYAFVDNRPEVLACIASGQNAREAASALGLGQHQLIASSAAGNIIRGPGDPQTVNRLAQQQKITLCFPAEADVCMIMTPLTPFRGHDHHLHHGHAHERDAPNPPPDWGVTPPETIIRWN